MGDASKVVFGWTLEDIAIAGLNSLLVYGVLRCRHSFAKKTQVFKTVLILCNTSNQKQTEPILFLKLEFTAELCLSSQTSSSARSYSSIRSGKYPLGNVHKSYRAHLPFGLGSTAMDNNWPKKWPSSQAME